MNIKTDNMIIDNNCAENQKYKMYGNFENKETDNNPQIDNMIKETNKINYNNIDTIKNYLELNEKFLLTDTLFHSKCLSSQYKLKLSNNTSKETINLFKTLIYSNIWRSYYNYLKFVLLKQIENFESENEIIKEACEFLSKVTNERYYNKDNILNVENVYNILLPNNNFCTDFQINDMNNFLDENNLYNDEIWSNIFSIISTNIFKMFFPGKPSDLITSSLINSKEVTDTKILSGYMFIFNNNEMYIYCMYTYNRNLIDNKMLYQWNIIKDNIVTNKNV